MKVFFQTRLGNILIWQKLSGTWESDFKRNITTKGQAKEGENFRHQKKVASFFKTFGRNRWFDEKREIHVIKIRISYWRWSYQESNEFVKLLKSIKDVVSWCIFMLLFFLTLMPGDVIYVLNSLNFGKNVEINWE